MKAVNNYVVVDKIKTTGKQVSGLLITEDTDVDNRYDKGKVLSVGNLVEGIKPDDVVFFDKHAGHGIRWDDTIYYIIRSGDVVLIE
jgi:co-chaperonin GroES (HSP10)